MASTALSLSLWRDGRSSLGKRSLFVRATEQSYVSVCFINRLPISATVRAVVDRHGRVSHLLDKRWNSGEHLRRDHDLCVASCDSPVDGERRGDQGAENSEKVESGRREFMMLSIFFSSFLTLMSATAGAADDPTEIPLELYSDPKDGFELLRPAPWNKIDKPGAALFFEDPNSRSNNIGVTVAPVRIASLDVFGTVDDIVQKLVKAEREKPSTKDIQVIQVLEKKLRDNVSLYSLEYTLDTTRGSKHVLTCVTVAAYKLYILSIIYADSPMTPASPELGDALHRVLNSFDLRMA